jgi:hypothetical protein
VITAGTARRLAEVHRPHRQPVAREQPASGRRAIVAGCSILAYVRNNCTAGNRRVNLIPMLGDPQAEELRSAGLVEAGRMTPHLKNLSWL